MGYIGHTRGICCGGIIEKLWCNRYCCGYAMRMHGPCFNDLAYVFYTAARGCICSAYAY